MKFSFVLYIPGNKSFFFKKFKWELLVYAESHIFDIYSPCLMYSLDIIQLDRQYGLQQSNGRKKSLNNFIYYYKYSL